jgi:hypothetical protein
MLSSMSDVVAEAIREVTSATRRIGQESAHSSTRVTRDGDHFSFPLPENDPGVKMTVGVTAGLAAVMGFFAQFISPRDSTSR